MSVSFYDLMKYARTGIASPDMKGFDKLRARAAFGGYPVSTITGAPPISFKSDGKPLTAWSISGNMAQTGTPTPDAPIMPEFCGVRTGNLFDYVSYFDSTFTNYNQFFDYVDLQLSANTTYTLSTSYTEVGTNPRNTSFIVAKPNDAPTTASGGISSTSPITITTGSDGKLRLYKRISGSSEHPTKSQFDNGEWLMLNIGSTALPYEPFGWAEKITCAGQTVPVYLGQTVTTRRVRKLVLTGEEDWIDSSVAGSSVKRYRAPLPLMAIDGSIQVAFCTHYQYVYAANDPGFNIAQVGTSIYFRSDFADDVPTWKAYLAEQYAAGTPVTVWYVLATPETAIVNEPLCKIGDYADELRSTDAGVTIPTVRGSNTLTVDTTLQPSAVSVTGHIKSS